MKLRKALVVICATTLISGCAATATPPDEYSGFLNDYSKLKEVRSPTGVDVMRWIDPSVSASSYSGIYLEPTLLYPEPRPTEQISSAVLQGIARYYDDALKRELSKTSRLVSAPGPGVLVLRPAITAVSRQTEGFKPYEVLPIALVAAAVNTAAGGRDQTTTIATEVAFIDAGSNRVVAQLVRKGSGKDLENSETAMTVNDAKELLDGWASDIQQSFERIKTAAK